MVWESCLLEKADVRGMLITQWDETSWALPVLALKANYRVGLDTWPQKISWARSSFILKLKWSKTFRFASMMMRVSLFWILKIVKSDHLFSQQSLSSLITGKMENLYILQASLSSSTTCGSKVPHNKIEYPSLMGRQFLLISPIIAEISPMPIQNYRMEISVPPSFLVIHTCQTPYF